jgi:hypothetical protein
VIRIIFQFAAQALLYAGAALFALSLLWEMSMVAALLDFSARHAPEYDRCNGHIKVRWDRTKRESMTTPDCPNCEASQFVFRSQRRPWEILLSLLNVYPYTCDTCELRFYGWGRGH